MSRNIHYLVDNLSLIAHKIAKEANIAFPMTWRLLYRLYIFYKHSALYCNHIAIVVAAAYSAILWLFVMDRLIKQIES